MSAKTNIEWCDSTINGSSGCDGCELWNAQKHSCYAGTLHETRWAHSFALTHPQFYSASFSEVKMIPGRFAQAAAWSCLTGTKRPAKPWLNGLPRHIFVGDMGDFLSRDVSDEFLTREMMGAIRSRAGQRHIWMLLTKRPARLASLSRRWGGLPENVIAMTTVTDQGTADARISQLLKVQCHWRAISAEPLLGPVDLRFTNGLVHGEDAADRRVNWVICGGESGKDALPMHPDWARSLRDQCATAGVPFLYKQWGEWAPSDASCCDGFVHDGSPYRPLNLGYMPGPPDCTPMARVGKHAAGRLLDGIEHNGFPHLREEAWAET